MKKIFLVLALTAAVLFGLFGLVNSVATTECPEGYPVDCGDYCCPGGNVCCGDGNCCPSGSNCCPAGLCCPGGLPILCVNTGVCYQNHIDAEQDGCANWTMCGVP